MAKSFSNKKSSGYNRKTRNINSISPYSQASARYLRRNCSRLGYYSLCGVLVAIEKTGTSRQFEVADVFNNPKFNRWFNSRRRK